MSACLPAASLFCLAYSFLPALLHPWLPSFLPANSPALLPACKPACPATTLGRALPGSLGIIDPGEGVACRTQPYHTTPHHATPSPSCTFCSCCSCYCWGGISLDLHLHLPSCPTHCAMSFCCPLSHLILSSYPHSILPHHATLFLLLRLLLGRFILLHSHIHPTFCTTYFASLSLSSF